MHYVYILKSKLGNEIYIGVTNDLKRRLIEHNEGKSFATKRYAPWEIVYLEGYADRNDAEDRESKLKQFGKVYAHLKRRIRRSLKS